MLTEYLIKQTVNNVFSRENEIYLIKYMHFERVYLFFFFFLKDRGNKKQNKNNKNT